MKGIVILLLLATQLLFSQTTLKNKLAERYGHYNKISDDYYLVYSNSKSGVADSLGKEIVPLIYDRLEYKNGLLIAEQTGKKGLITVNNNIVTPVQYDWILPRSNNTFHILHNNMHGVIDTANNFILPLQYENIISYLKNYYIVMNKKGLSGIYNYQGDNVIPEKYVFYNVDSSKIFCTENNRCMILDFYNSEKSVYLASNIEFKKQHKHHITHELFHQIFITDKKYGLISSSNQVLIPALYDDLTNLLDGSIFIAKLNNKYGIISYENKIVEDIIYDSVDIKKEVIVLKRKGVKNKYYIISSKQVNPAEP